MPDDDPNIPIEDLERVRKALHAATTASLLATPAVPRRRTRLLVIVAVACLVAASAALAAQALLDQPTAASIDEVANAPTLRAGFENLLTDPNITQGTTLGPNTPVSKAFDLPTNTPYAGHSVYVATSTNGWMCVKALDGAACGQETPEAPAVGFVLAHPSSGLPPLATGVTAPNVVGVSFQCTSGTYRASMITDRGYALVLDKGQTLTGCTQIITLASGENIEIGRG